MFPGNFSLTRKSHDGQNFSKNTGATLLHKASFAFLPCAAAEPVRPSLHKAEGQRGKLSKQRRFIMYKLKEKTVKAAEKFLVQRGCKVVEINWKSEIGSSSTR